MVKSLFQCMVILSDPYTADYRVFRLPLLEAWVEDSKLMGFSTPYAQAGSWLFLQEFSVSVGISSGDLAFPQDEFSIKQFLVTPIYILAVSVSFVPTSEVRQTQILKKLVLSLKGANKMAGAAWKHGGGRRLTNSIRQPSLFSPRTSHCE